MPLFVVETVSMTRHKYVIEAQDVEHAYDAVVAEEADEFSQMYLGETVVTGKEISKKKFGKMVEALKTNGDGTHYQPEHGSYWMGEGLIHKIDYSK